MDRPTEQRRPLLTKAPAGRARLVQKSGYSRQNEIVSVFNLLCMATKSGEKVAQLN
jgi:hypothetical protein